MKKLIKTFIVVAFALIVALGFTSKAYAADESAENTAMTAETESESDSSVTGTKAQAAGLAIAIAASAGAIAMGIAIAKSVEGISRQPEAAGQIRTSLMLGLVFVETAIIYALIVAILIIFVL